MKNEWMDQIMVLLSISNEINDKGLNREPGKRESRRKQLARLCLNVHSIFGVCFCPYSEIA